MNVFNLFSILMLVGALSVTSSPLAFDPIHLLSSTKSIPSSWLGSDVVAYRTAIQLCSYGHCSWDVYLHRFYISDFLLPSPNHPLHPALNLKKIEWLYATSKKGETVLDLKFDSPRLTIIFTKVREASR